jgi:hypothetical protein
MIEILDRSILTPEIQYKLLCSNNFSPLIKMEEQNCRILLTTNWKLGWAYIIDMLITISLFFIHLGITIYYQLWWIVWISWLSLIILSIAFSWRNSRPWHYIFIIWVPLIFQYYLSLVFIISYIVTHLLFLFIYQLTLKEFKREKEIFLTAVQQWIVSVYPDSNIDTENLNKYIGNID